MYVCMFLTRCHEFPFPATRGHLPRGATFAPNRRWPLVAGTTVVLILTVSTRVMKYAYLDSIPQLLLKELPEGTYFRNIACSTIVCVLAMYRQCTI